MHSQGISITTDIIVNETNVLQAVNDNGSHYSIIPSSGDISSWIETYSTATEKPHYYTTVLRGGVFMFQEYDVNWLDALDESENVVSNDTILFFAQSNIPTDYFLKQFIKPGLKPYCEKRYWNSFAKILIKREFEALKNYLDIMLIWLQDLNWPGSNIILDYFVEKFDLVKADFLRAIFISIDSNDESWLLGLLNVLIKKNILSKSECLKIFDDFSISNKDNAKLKNQIKILIN